MLQFMSDFIGENNRILKQRTWLTDVEPTAKFADVFNANVPTEYADCPVSVLLGYKKPDSEPGNWCGALLTQSVSLLQAQGGNYVRFQVRDRKGFYTFKLLRTVC